MKGHSNSKPTFIMTLHVRQVLQTFCSSSTQAEQEVIAMELAALRAEQPEAVRSGLEAALLAGVAAHHAGCLPAWKSLVERCFQRGAALHGLSSVSIYSKMCMLFRVAAARSCAHHICCKGRKMRTH